MCPIERFCVDRFHRGKGPGLGVYSLSREYNPRHGCCLACTHRLGHDRPNDFPPHDRTDYPMKPDTLLKACLSAAAMISLVLSVVIYFAAGDDINGRLNGIFVGVWVPSILSLGALLLAARKSES